MIVFKEITLGSESIDYIKNILKHGNTLSSNLLQSSDFDNGEVKTFLPHDVSNEDARYFKFGGKIKPPTIFEKMSLPIPSTTNYLIDTIQSFLREKEGRLCIFEDATRIPSDPWISLNDTRLFIYKNEVYYILFAGDADNKEKIDDTIWDSDSHWHFVCVMTSVPQESGFFRDAKSININDLSILAERAEKIAIGAYDGEAYLIWTEKLVGLPDVSEK